mmetsp:Transcript_30823/g.46757  ORF Transcript_30823/g.46757 Transcript_30823/m.46757 type:complete len:258 (+) Transcript_30823:112-885(+)
MPASTLHLTLPSSSSTPFANNNDTTNSFVVLIPKVTDCQNGRYRKLPPEEWEWTHSRSFVPSMLAERGISLPFWQQTFDAVQRVRMQTQKQFKAAARYQYDSLFYGIIAGAALAIIVLLLNGVSGGTWIIDELAGRIEVTGFFQRTIMWIVYFTIVIAIIHIILLRQRDAFISKGRAQNLEWKRLREEQDCLYRKLGNISVALEGIFDAGSTTNGMVLGLRFEALTIASSSFNVAVEAEEEKLGLLANEDHQVSNDV